jgi:hypothetical protein
VDKNNESGHGTWRERNMLRVFIISVFVLAGLYFVVGVMSLIFPELGIPMMWMAFPIGPAGPPIQ